MDFASLQALEGYTEKQSAQYCVAKDQVLLVPGMIAKPSTAAALVAQSSLPPRNVVRRIACRGTVDARSQAPRRMPLLPSPRGIIMRVRGVAPPNAPQRLYLRADRRACMHHAYLLLNLRLCNLLFCAIAINAPVCSPGLGLGMCVAKGKITSFPAMCLLLQYRQVRQRSPRRGHDVAKVC